MYTKSRVMGVKGGNILTAPSSTSGSMFVPNSNPVTASLAGAGGMLPSSAPVSVGGYYSSQYQYLMTGLIPAEPSYSDSSSLSLFYRDCYLHDCVGGSAVDIQSSFPFSDWELRGLPEAELQIYRDSLAQLNLQQMMPTISTAYLVDGFFCGSLIFDPATKQFLDTLLHDALQCTVLPSPFFNAMPTVKVRTGAATQQFLSSDSVFAREHLKNLPSDFVDLLRSGSFTLNPVSTMFVARRSLTDRAFTSYLHRILPMYLIEKTLFRGTLVEVSRRQRALTHVTVGDDTWTPSTEELLAIVQQFQAAENDPLGGWVTTRNAVQASDIRPAGDFLKWTDMADILTPYKLRALGISEAFLSEETSYASAESAYSTFLESMNSYRGHLTHSVFTSTLFPLIAVANRLYKDPSKSVVRGDITRYLANVSNRNNLKLPELVWHKSLEAKDEDDKFDMLEKASDKGVPIPLKAWMAAAGIDSETLLKDLKEDVDLRKQLEEFTGKDTSHEGEDEVEMEMARTRFSYPTAMSMKGGARNRRALLARDFGESGEIVGTNKSGSGKKFVHNQAKHRKRLNEMLVKISSRMDKDVNYRMEIAKRNKERLGSTTLPGINSFNKARG